MRHVPISDRLNHRSRTVWTMIFPIVIMLLLIAFAQGCFESVGEKAARIVAEDVIPKLTGESAQWRQLAAETRDKLPAEFRHEFDLAFNRAAAAVETNVQCVVDFARARIRQDLEALMQKWRGEGSGPSPIPHFCNISPDHVIALDQNERPKDQNWLVFYGYDFTDYNDRLLVQVLLEYKDGRRVDITECCLDNPTHYNLTVDFDEVDFVNTRRLVLIGNSAQEWKTVGIDHPLPAAPTVTRYVVTTNTACQSDADTDSNVRISILGESASIQDWNLEIPDHDDRGKCGADTYTSQPIQDIGTIRYAIVTLAGNDGWLLSSLTIVNEGSGKQWYFPCNQWFDTDNSERVSVRILYPDDNSCSPYP